MSLLVKEGENDVTRGGKRAKMVENGESWGAPAPVPVRLVVHLGTYHNVAGVSYMFCGKWVEGHCSYKRVKMMLHRVRKWVKRVENGKRWGAPAPAPVHLVVHLGTYHNVAGISYTFCGRWVGCHC